MALPVSVPYAFANATTTQNLAYLDSNFNTLSYTLNGIGNGTVSLANVSITGGTISANLSSTSIHNGTSNVSVDSSNGPVSINTNGSNAMYIDASQNVGIGTTSPVNPLTVNGNGVSLLPSYATYLANSYYGGSPTAWRYVGNGIAWGIGNNFGGVTNGVTIAVAASNSGGAGAALTWNPAVNIDSSGNLLVGYTSSNGSYKLQVNSQIFATSATIATSDANYKTNVTPLSGALNLVQKLNPVSFNWEKHPVHNFDTETPTVGFLAQEVQTALADTGYVNSIVKESEVTLPDDTKEQFLGIAEGNMIALLTKAIQELSAEVTALKAKVGQ